jgi:hypothetical protein
MGRKFVDGPDRKDLPVGQHEPCRLESIKEYVPDEEVLAKFPDMKASLCFRFLMHCPDSEELHEASAVRFCNDTMSKLGSLYAFVTDLNGGKEPAEFEEADYVGKWFRIRVRKNARSGKLSVQSADRIDPPKDLEQAADKKVKEAVPSTVSSDNDVEGDDIPF